MNPHAPVWEAFAAAGRRVMQAGEALDDLYQEAVAADPGLPEALRLAREEDPDVGWLDVAAKRERERGKAEAGRRLAT